MMPFFITNQCLTLDFWAASFSIYCWKFSRFFVSIIFFRGSLSPIICSFVILHFSFSCSIDSIHRLSLFVVVWISLSFSIFKILLPCIIFLLFIYSSMLWNPVSARRMAVGVCCGRWRMVFSALLNIVYICSISPLVGSQDSDPYVMIGMIVVSISSQIALILILLNSLFPVSASISCVHAVILPLRLLIWSSRLSVLLIMTPGYLYAFTSSSTCPFSSIFGFRPGPHLTTLHLVLQSIFLSLACPVLLGPDLEIFSSIMASDWLRPVTAELPNHIIEVILGDFFL